MGIQQERTDRIDALRVLIERLCAPDLTLQARFRYQNEDRKQIVNFPTHASLEATILAIKERVAAFRDWMEEAAGEPFYLYERLGPMALSEMLDWLRETRDFVFVERKS
jgi:hypothetical protein